MNGIVKGKKNKSVPKIRFSGFFDPWKEYKLGDFLKQEIREVPKPLNLYKAIGIRSHFKGTFQKPGSDPKKIAMENLFLVKEHDFLLNITFAWEGALAIAKKEDDGGFVSHRFPTYVFDKNISSPSYFKYVFPTKRMKYMLDVISPGGAGRNRVLDKKDFLKIKINIPSVQEQKKISDFLCLIDEFIKNLNKQKKNLELYKNGILDKIFSKEILFKSNDNKSFSEWSVNKLGDCLNYEQPTNYIVKNTEYDDSFSTPVLTAGKGFILGYTNEHTGICNNLPVIIFDDFTTSSHFVDFPFKVKSSAIKILRTNAGFDIKFMFEVLKNIKYEIGGHERHWISKFSNMKVLLPCFEEQKRISKFLISIDRMIDIKNKQILLAEDWKKGLMNDLFI